MAIRELVAADDPILTQMAKRVEAFDADLHQLLDDMWETMHKHNGQGLSAPQIGVSLRVLIAENRGMRFELINPAILQPRAPYATRVEGCLSLPGILARVRRPSGVVVQGRNRNGRLIRIDAVNDLARCLQHEIDHLNGVLITKSGQAYSAPEGTDVA